MYILNAKGILKDFGLFMHTYIIYNKSEDIYFEDKKDKSQSPNILFVWKLHVPGRCHLNYCQRKCVWFHARARTMELWNFNI